MSLSLEAVGTEHAKQGPWVNEDRTGFSMNSTSCQSAGSLGTFPEPCSSGNSALGCALLGTIPSGNKRPPDRSAHSYLQRRRTGPAALSALGSAVPRGSGLKVREARPARARRTRERRPEPTAASRL